MAYSILQTPFHNLVNTQKPSVNILTLNNNTTKQIPKNQTGHIIKEKKNLLNNNIKVLSRKPQGYCNKKCPRCGLDIYFYKCS